MKELQDWLYIYDFLDARCFYSFVGIENSCCGKVYFRIVYLIFCFNAFVLVEIEDRGCGTIQQPGA